MIRKQIYIQAEQESMLKRLSKDMGLSEAEIIRQAIDRQLEELEWRQRALKAWESEKAFIRKRVKQGSVHGERTWKREDLYDRHAR
jgi:predicted DNA-binding protein